MMPTNTIIRPLHEQDIETVAAIHTECFPRQKLSNLWISSNFKAFPRIQLFIAEASGRPVGYIQWTVKCGFRPEAIIELEQLAVSPAMQNHGIGSALIEQSLAKVQTNLMPLGLSIKHILVSTRADNYAQKIYAKTLGAQPVAVIPGLFSTEEVLMVAYNVTTNPTMPTKNSSITPHKI